MTDRIIERFEIVQIDEQHRRIIVPCALALGNNSGQFVFKNSPFGQTGKASLYAMCSNFCSFCF